MGVKAFFEIGGIELPAYPSPTDLRSIIEQLEEGQDSFIIAMIEETFIQCCKTDGRFCLQRNDGEKLFQCKDENLSVAQLVDTFHEFGAAGKTWQSKFGWDEVGVQNLKTAPTEFEKMIAWLGLKGVFIVAAGIVLCAVLGMLVGHFVR